MDMIRSLRERALPITTIRIEEAYDWVRYDDDPEDHFAATESLHANAAQSEDYIADTLARVVYGSNLIERAGSTLEVTTAISNKIFRGHNPPEEEITQRDAEYHEIRTDLLERNQPATHVDVLHTRREIVQHCLVLGHHIASTVLANAPLTESLILETHKILTHKIPSSDGDGPSSYGGRYRIDPVGAGFTTFTPPTSVLSKMRSMLSTYPSDTVLASSTKSVDSFFQAAKYCHKFVNIHPFADGNGRTCRIILNGILLQ